jgi:hypothetical protein
MKNTLRASALCLALLMGCGKAGDIPGTGGIGTQSDPALTSVSDITGAENRRDLVGRKVVFENVRATSIVGDVTFWVGQNNNTALVVKGSELRHQGDEGRIRSGHNYRITGTVRLVENVPRTDPTWRLVDDREYEAIAAGLVYVESDTITLMK